MREKKSFRLAAPVLLCVVLVFVGHAGVLADSGSGHQAAQAWPISLGTSGGNIYDRSSAFCCSGTLGALVQDGNGIKYVLSNNHVLGRFNQASPGEPVNQPGMIDQNCDQNGVVAYVSDVVQIQTAKRRSTPTNLVDAAIAEVVPGAVKPNGDILDIGAISSDVMQAYVNQSVQKSGRTTGHTTGTVTAVDVTVDVGYSTSCGGASNNVARFVNQILIAPASFSDSGDSGSLIVETGNNPADGLPRAVGLLFAGSSSSTIANPIGPVLSLLGVDMVGGVSAPGPTGLVSGTVRNAIDNSPLEGASVSVDTGQSTETNSSGWYEIIGVPTGPRTVTASALSFVSSQQTVLVSEDATSTVNFDLEEAVIPTSAAVGCVTYATSGGKNNDRNLDIAVSVINNFGFVVSGAQVSVSVYLNGSLYGTATGTTNSDGIASFTGSRAPDGTYTTTVKSIAASGLTFDQASSPANAFEKGTDSTPAAYCNGGLSSGTEISSLSSQVSRARAAKARNSDILLNIPGVRGHGIGLNSEGSPVIEVYLESENAAARQQIPAHIENVPVRVVVTGDFVAY